jgi:N-hydroxyarylamine O-acetyltransferase
MAMNIGEYLKRLNYSDPIGTDIETLRGLQIAHMKNIPFENLDISLGRNIELTDNALWDKLIRHKRGGFCYELNGLFAWLLKQIGFQVTYLNARDYKEESDSFGIDFDHLTLLVKTPGTSSRWLVDVGWGDSFTQPLDIDDPSEQKQELRGYRVEPFKHGYQLWQRNFDGALERQYYFDLEPHLFPKDYLETCRYHQTSPSSIFTQRSIITRLTENGRVSLDNNKLTITSNGNKTTREVNEFERPGLIKQYFDFTISG